MRKWLGALVVLACLLTIVPTHASVSFTVLFDALVAESSTVNVVTPTEQRSVWEDGRIYTYTRVVVDRPIAGDLGSGADTWVRTMGGVVDKVGQQVDGEAVLEVGKPSLVFLKKSVAGTHVVVARAQGQFPIVQGAQKTQRTSVVFARGVLLPPKSDTLAIVRARTSVATASLPAADVLAQKTVDEAAREVRDAWQRTHAP